MDKRNGRPDGHFYLKTSVLTTLLLVHITPHCCKQPRHVLLWLANSCMAQARKQRWEYNKQELEAENEAIILENRALRV
jgi:hypothetical protein